MRDILIFGLLFILSSCTRKLIFVQPCTKEILLTEFLEHERKAYKNNNVQAQVYENDSSFIIQYWPIKPGTRDGVGQIEVSKKTCKIIKQVHGRIGEK